LTNVAHLIAGKGYRVELGRAAAQRSLFVSPRTVSSGCRGGPRRRPDVPVL